jgi:hypothetical protein
MKHEHDYQAIAIGYTVLYKHKYFRVEYKCNICGKKLIHYNKES